MPKLETIVRDEEKMRETPKDKTVRELMRKRSEGMRRFVSKSQGLTIIEPHRELRDPLTKSIVEVESTISGKKMQPKELKTVTFHQGGIPWPPRGLEYEIRVAGIFESADAEQIKLCEYCLADAVKRGAPDLLMEYPYDWEIEMRQHPQGRKVGRMTIEGSVM
jgi:hypothetical protein